MLEGLRVPVWPAEMLIPIDERKAEHGKLLYAAHCKHCHPLIDELRTELASANSSSWTSRQPACVPPEPRLIKLPMINLKTIGTDPAQATNMHKRVVTTPYGTFSEGQALLMVTAQVRQKAYDRLGLEDARRAEFDSSRAMPALDALEREAPLAIADNLGYRSRPLDGVWATAPYLHNGSVPNLYEMLLPADRRSTVFYTGGREFDPERVGLHCTAAEGVFKFDTRLTGNLNCGHEFRNLKLEEFERYRGLAPTQRANPADRWAAALGLSPSEYREMTAERQRLHVRAESRYWLEQNSHAAKRPAGVLGAEFTNEERSALVEYLKSL